LEEIMKTHTIITALVFGAALASGPAFAQVHNGKALNDGGMVDAPSTPAPKTIYNSVAPASVHYGKGLDDGGMVDPPSAGQLAAQGKIQTIQNPPHYGKALDDGGL
jgi:hypothetical protein